MLGKVNNVLVLSPTPLGDDFFKYWLVFLKPLHNLTDREMDVTAAFLRHRYHLSKVIKDNTILENVVMSEDTKSKIREECGVSSAHFQVIVGKLKKVKIIVDGRINPKLIPNIEEDQDSLQLLLSFPIK